MSSTDDIAQSDDGTWYIKGLTAVFATKADAENAANEMSAPSQPNPQPTDPREEKSEIEPRAIQNGMRHAEYTTWLFLADKKALDEPYTYAVKQSDLTALLTQAAKDGEAKGRPTDQDLRLAITKGCAQKLDLMPTEQIFQGTTNETTVLELAEAIIASLQPTQSQGESKS